jgi:hypothetical protein
MSFDELIVNTKHPSKAIFAFITDGASSNAGAKVRLFSDSANFFAEKNKKEPPDSRPAVFF